MIQIVKERVIPISGDLSIEKLGIDPQVRIELIETLDIIISSAASVHFNDHLHDAIKINYLGATRILDLAHECKHIEVLSHVSTAFVGSNQPNRAFLNEVIQPDRCKDDWEVQIKRIMSMDREAVSKIETELR